jgi:hypothetical protein
LASLTIEESRDARLPVSSDEATWLVMRGLYEAADLRATPWLIAGYRHADVRVQNEAMRAMHFVALRLTPTRERWAHDLPLGSYGAFLRTHRAGAEELRAHPNAAIRVFSDVVLAEIDAAGQPAR